MVYSVHKRFCSVCDPGKLGVVTEQSAASMVWIATRWLWIELLNASSSMLMCCEACRHLSSYQLVAALFATGQQDMKNFVICFVILP